MKNNMLAVLAIVLSAIALAASIFAISRVSKVEEQISNSGSVQTIPEHVNEESAMNEGEVETLTPTHPFDQSLVGEWETDYAWMTILEDSTLYVEENCNENGSVVNGEIVYEIPYRLYIGYVENYTVVIEKRADCTLEEYLANPDGFEFKDMFNATDLVRPSSDSLKIDYRKNGAPRTFLRRQE